MKPALCLQGFSKNSQCGIGRCRRQPRKTESNGRKTENGSAACFRILRPPVKSPPDLPLQEKRSKLAETVQPLDREAMENFCRANGFTQAALCFAAVCYAVCRWTQGNDAWLSAISSGRSDPRLRATIGMFVQTVPLGVSLGENMSRMAYVRSVQGSLNEAIVHEEYPYASVCEEYGFAPHIMYACELGIAATAQFDGKAAVMTPLAMPEPKFDLSIHVEERDGKPVFAVQYDSALYSAWIMDRFADTLGMALAGILARPDEPVRTLSLVSPQQEKLLESINDTSFPLDEMALHRKFEAQAARWPHRAALVADEGRYEYAALNAAANRLAHGLLALGLQPEERVAFALPRTGRIIVAMLGILKAGGPIFRLILNIPQNASPMCWKTAGRVSSSQTAEAATSAPEEAQPS